MDELAPACVSQSANTCGGCCECTALGLRSRRSHRALRAGRCVSLAIKLDFILIGLMVVAALVATYIAGRLDKRKARGPWAKGDADS